MNKNRRKERKSQKKNVDKNGEKVGEKDSNKKQTNVSARIGWTRQSKKENLTTYTVLYSMYNIKNNKNGIKVDGKSNYRIVQEQKKNKDIIQDF